MYIVHLIFVMKKDNFDHTKMTIHNPTSAIRQQYTKSH